jgi:uncharacterized hydantoinase/oxoprolinase family protein
VLGQLPEDADQHPAADGGPKSWEASARRLGRMIGADLTEGERQDWCALAGWFARCQLRSVEDALALQTSRGLVAVDAPLVGAGCGRVLLPDLASRLGRPWRDFTELVEADPGARPWVATCAPAVAVAVLAGEERRGR